MQKWGERIFSNLQLGMTVYINQDSNDNGVRIVKFTT